LKEKVLIFLEKADNFVCNLFRKFVALKQICKSCHSVHTLLFRNTILCRRPIITKKEAVFFKHYLSLKYEVPR